MVMMTTTTTMMLAFFNTALRPLSSMKQAQSIAHGCAEKRRRTSRRSSLKRVRALFNPGDDPIFKEVLKVRLDIVAFCFHRSRVVVLFSNF
jgi:hypothetical protein